MKKLIIYISLFFIPLSIYGQNEDENNLVKIDSISSDSNYDLIAIPIALFTPETGFAFGGGGQLYFLDEKQTFRNRLSNILFSGIYTLNEQLMIDITPQIYFSGGDYFIDAQYLLEIYPNSFWGIGNNSPNGAEEEYKQTTHALSISFLKRLPPDLNFGFQLIFKNHEVTEIEDDGILATGNILGSKRTVVAGLGSIFTYDTRDNTGSPTKGFYYQLKANFSSEIFGATSGFNKFIIDLREYLPIGGKHLLAFQLFFESNYGEVPFQALAFYGGGARARGYFYGRYIDKHMYVSQTEFRWRIYPRWTINSFFLFGEVAEEPEDFFSIKNIKPGFGLGVRYKIFEDKNTWLRFDFGKGVEGSTGIYFGINEAF